MVFLLLYLLITVGIYENETQRMPYGFLDPGENIAPVMYLVLMVACLLFYALAWSIAKARSRARDGTGAVEYCKLFWCGPPNMCVCCRENEDVHEPIA